MKPTQNRPKAAIIKAQWQLYRSLCIERAKIVARLRQLETHEIAECLPPTYSMIAGIPAARRMARD